MIEQLASTRQRHDAFEILDLAPFHNSVLGFVVCVGQVFTHGRDAWASMCLGHDFLRRKTVGPRPSAPNPRYRRRRVDEHSIHIEQKSSATDLGHGLMLRAPGHELRATRTRLLEARSSRLVALELPKTVRKLPHQAASREGLQMTLANSVGNPQMRNRQYDA